MNEAGNGSAHETHVHHEHEHDHAQEHGGLGSHDAACSGHAETCGAEADACCGGHGTDEMFAFPTTTEVVSIPATQLAGLLDLAEKLTDDPRILAGEPDYIEAQRLLGEQAPRLVELREQFLERMKVLMAQVQH